MRNKFWMGMCALSISILILSFAVGEKVSPKTEEERSFRQYCGSKFSGSRPTCWSEEDWDLFCEKVQCKGI